MQTLHALVDAGSDMDCTDGSGTTLLALAGETQVKGSVLAFDLCVPLPPCRRHRHSLRPSPVQTPPPQYRHRSQHVPGNALLVSRRRFHRHARVCVCFSAVRGGRTASVEYLRTRGASESLRDTAARSGAVVAAGSAELQVRAAPKR